MAEVGFKKYIFVKMSSVSECCFISVNYDHLFQYTDVKDYGEHLQSIVIRKDGLTYGYVRDKHSFSSKFFL